MARSISIGIVGTGWVGASVAISVLHAGFAQELLLCDSRAAVAEGEAMDLAQGAAFYPAARVRAVALAELQQADAVVIAAGRGGRADESRLALAKDNASIVRDIAGAMRAFDGLVVVVTNPVDPLTFLAARASGLPLSRVIGTGTMLDTARLRQAIGRTLNVAPQSVHAQVVGEHGDSEVVLWSSARVGGVPIRQWPRWDVSIERQLASEVRTAAYEIIRRKGATNHAIGLVTAALLRSALRGENRVLTVSRVQEGTAGISNVALSLPAIVGVNGADSVVAPELDAEERTALNRSADVLANAIAAVS